MAKKAKKSKASKTPVKKASKTSVKKASNTPVRKASKTPAKKAAKPAAKKLAKKTAAPVNLSGSALMSVSPGFTSNDAAASIVWYCDVLGFKIIEKWEHEGQFLGAQIGRDNVSFNIGQDDWKLGRDRVKGQGVRMYITTGPDIDAFAADIKSRGGVLDGDPQDGWGMRAFSIKDPDGFNLTFMTPKK